MPNVLYITGTEQAKRGGVNQVAQGYAEALAKSNYQVTFIYGYGPDGYLRSMPKLFRKFDLFFGPLLLKLKIESVLQKQKIDLVHAHGIDACFDTAVLKNWLNKKNIKVVATLHGLDRNILQALQDELNLGNINLSPLTIFHLLYFSLSVKKENFAYPKFDYLFAVSPGVAKKAFKYHQLSAKYLPNGISIQKDKTVLNRYSLGIEDTAKVILFIGVSSWLKGFRYLEQTINKNYTYLIVGFKLPEDIRKKFSNIINIPYASGQEISDLFKTADLFVHTALNEPFGLVYLEAFYHQIPVLSFKNDGTDLLIRDGETGFVVPPRDIAALSNKIKYIFNNPQLITQITKKAHAELKNFNYLKHTRELINDYENIRQIKISC
jgi:glycosyltransferase involved in cell wall biosynthesis